jgi:hypothetical protein
LQDYGTERGDPGFLEIPEGDNALLGSLASNTDDLDMFLHGQRVDPKQQLYNIDDIALCTAPSNEYFHAFGILRWRLGILSYWDGLQLAGGQLGITVRRSCAM